LPHFRTGVVTITERRELATLVFFLLIYIANKRITMSTKIEKYSDFDTNKEGVIKPKESKGTPLLDSLGRDLSKLAAEGKIDPVIGRDKEIFQVLLVLSRKTKNNPVIIGDPGVGKTAIVEGIAQMIYDGECPDSLKGKRIVSLDMGSLMAGASAQGEFEKRLKILQKELLNNPDVIPFIDEIHLMVNPSISIDAANMFKPALARGEMRCIGATTLNEFRNSIEKDGALDRRFQKVIINEPSITDTLEILNKIKSKYEDYHSVKYTNKAIDACVKLSGRYITDRFFPDKAIDLLDEVGAKVRLLNPKQTPKEILDIEKQIIDIIKKKEDALKAQKWEDAAEYRNDEAAKLGDLERVNNKYKGINDIIVDEDEVAKVLADKTGIPVNKIGEDEGEKLLRMEKDLSIEIIGQDDAVSKISKSLRRSRVGLKDPKRPAGVFLFLGSTGTGKTQTVKTLAKYLFGSEDKMIRVDMSEYKEKHNASRMIGSPPGYVGYGEGGQLTEKVRRNPYSVVLFDEIEKAHPDVLTLMLQIFDDGFLTDGQGRKIDFRNTIIIMTSNIGSTAVQNMIAPVGFAQASAAKLENSKDIIKKELEKTFPPEFINRIDDIIIFSKLGKPEIYKIIDVEIIKLAERLKGMGYDLTITDAVKDFLMEVGYDPNMGARPLKRAIQTYIEDPISDEILRKNIVDVINLDYDFEKKKFIINGNIITEKLNKIKLFEHFKMELKRLSL